MTEKDLARLKRPDLLALLVAQGRDAGELQARLEETAQTLARAEQQVEHLKDKLDEKDGQIEHLKEKLNEKDTQLERLKEKLNEKDVQLAHLRRRLDEKDTEITALVDQIEKLATRRYFEMEGAQSLTDISARIDLMLRLAQRAANQYMKEI